MSDMLPYLVDKLGLNVNEMDREQEDLRGGHHGTPLCYAIYDDGDDVVKWLLDRGARMLVGPRESRGDARWFCRAMRATD